MSAGSVTAYLSPTIARNRAINSGDNGANGVWTMFIGVSWILTCLYICPDLLSANRGAAQPIVDGLTQTVMRHRHDCDGARAFGVQLTKIAEKIGRGLAKIARRGQIHHGFRRMGAFESRMTESEKGL